MCRAKPTITNAQTEIPDVGPAGNQSSGLKKWKEIYDCIVRGLYAFTSLKIRRILTHFKIIP